MVWPNPALTLLHCPYLTTPLPGVVYSLVDLIPFCMSVKDSSAVLFKFHAPQMSLLSMMTRRHSFSTYHRLQQAGITKATLLGILQDGCSVDFVHTLEVFHSYEILVDIAIYVGGCSGAESAGSTQ